jgi:hypothetical protein
MAQQVATLIGRPIDGLTLAEQLAHCGRWVALEIYTPQTLPLRTIEAEGESVAECIAQLTGRGLDPGHFEFQLLQPPY